VLDLKIIGTIKAYSLDFAILKYYRKRHKIIKKMGEKNNGGE